MKRESSCLFSYTCQENPEVVHINFTMYRLKRIILNIYLQLRTLLLKVAKILLFPNIQIKYKSIQKIIVIRIDRIGDMVLTTPFLQSLRSTFPKAEIAVLANSYNSLILANNPDVNKVFIYEKKQSILEKIGFLLKLRRGGFDLVFDMLLGYQLKTALIALCIGRKYRIGFEIAGRNIFFNLDGPSGKAKKHIVEHNADLIRALGESVTSKLPRIFLSEVERQNAKKFLVKRGIKTDELIIGVHPGGYYESQCWLPERFATVADRLISKYEAQILVFGAKSDQEQVTVLVQSMQNQPVIAVKLGLREFIAVLSFSHLLLCNNSGPLHIASALGIPTVSTMGPTVPYLCWPVGENHIVLRKSLECSPCERAVCKEHHCMTAISVEDFWEAVSIQMKSKVANWQGGKRAKRQYESNEQTEIILMSGMI